MTDLLEKMESYIEDNSSETIKFQRRVDTWFSKWNSDKGLRWCANALVEPQLQHGVQGHGNG